MRIMGTQKTYKARKHAPFSDEKAQIYGECIEQIIATKKGARPIDVVNVAMDVHSPLHSYFEWDDELASNKYRVWQARQLQAQILTVVVTPSGDEISQRAFLNVSVVTETTKEPIYVTIKEALTNEEYRAQTLAKALEEIELWCNKYKDYRELIPIFTAIAEVNKQ